MRSSSPRRNSCIDWSRSAARAASSSRISSGTPRIVICTAMCPLGRHGRQLAIDCRGGSRTALSPPASQLSCRAKPRNLKPGHPTRMQCTPGLSVLSLSMGCRAHGTSRQSREACPRNSEERESASPLHRVSAIVKYPVYPTVKHPVFQSSQGNFHFLHQTHSFRARPNTTNQALLPGAKFANRPNEVEMWTHALGPFTPSASSGQALTLSRAGERG